MDDAEETLSGFAFQILAAVTAKLRLPMVDSLKDGTTRWYVAVDPSVRRSDIIGKMGEWPQVARAMQNVGEKM